MQINQDDPVHQKSNKEDYSLSTPSKVVLTLVGTIIISFSVYETWKLKNVTGYTTLIIIGFICLLIVATGEWPAEVSFAGISTKTARRPKKMTDSKAALKLTEAQKEEGDFARNQKSSGQSASNNPNQINREVKKIEKYDEDLIQAILSNFPKANLVRNPIIANSTTDFILTIENRSLYIETRHLVREDSNFQGKTLDSILHIFPRTSVLLVITNSKNVSTAKNKVKEILETRGDVITWIDESYDPILRQTILDLLVQ